MNTASTVFVVDDDAAVRDSLSLLLRENGMLVETFESAEAFLPVCRSTTDACAVLDFRMPGMDGIQLQGELVRQEILLPVIFLTGHGDIPRCIQAIKAGAFDFLTKPVTAGMLMQSVKGALLECTRLRAQAQVVQTAASRLKSLTERERQVLLLAVRGLTNKEIARDLAISHRTVEIHRARLMFKTGTSKLIDLARLVAETNGLPL